MEKLKVSDFDNNLGGSNMLDVDWEEWVGNGRSGSEPSKGVLLLSEYKTTWRNLGVNTLEDLAHHYAQYDVLG